MENAADRKLPRGGCRDRVLSFATCEGESVKARSYSRNPERDAEIWRLRREGITYRVIATRFGLTAERVRQVCVCEARRAVKP